MVTIVGFSGSLRRESFNTKLLRAAVGMMPDAARLELASIRGIPLYDGDVEKEQGIPSAVRELKEKIIASDGVLVATPEYNNSIPGVVKNAIDWLSRPPSDIAGVFGDRPFAIMGATPGRGGTALSQNAWLPVLRTLRVRPFFGGRLLVARASDVFGDDGAIVDDQVKDQVARFVEGFVGFVRDSRAIR